MTPCRDTADAPRVLLESPDPDLTLVLVDVEAENAEAAVAAPWATAGPAMKRPLKIAQRLLASEGWDERRTFVYETSPNVKRSVSAFALRHDARGRCSSSMAFQAG